MSSVVHAEVYSAPKFSHYHHHFTAPARETNPIITTILCQVIKSSETQLFLFSHTKFDLTYFSHVRLISKITATVMISCLE